MKKTLKSICIILAISLFGFLLVGCGAYEPTVPDFVVNPPECRLEIEEILEREGWAIVPIFTGVDVITARKNSYTTRYDIIEEVRFHFPLLDRPATTVERSYEFQKNHMIQRDEFHHGRGDRFWWAVFRNDSVVSVWNRVEIDRE
ncbi:MAG: hypothetical protein FWE13_01750 [Firmicutes bacterium]|nr:hypothetical protein [Bacillota bacterium]